jgi:spermidine synthase
LTFALFVTVLLIAACGLVYELVAGALASYLLGDSVLQFSTVIGTYLFAMGVGSWLSRHVTRGVVARFVGVELLVAVVGGFSAPLLFLAFAYTTRSGSRSTARSSPSGALVGLEIPLLMRILRTRFTFKDVVANVLTFDYLGALAASLVFPLCSCRASGSCARRSLRDGERGGRALEHLAVPARARRGAAAARGVRGGARLLGVGIWRAQDVTQLAEEQLYADEVILARDTRYQRIVLTAWKEDLRLFLNGPPAVLLARRVPLPRGARAPRARRAPARGASSCSAAATGWPCARSCDIRRCARWCSSTSTPR